MLVGVASFAEQGVMGCWRVALQLRNFVRDSFYPMHSLHTWHRIVILIVACFLLSGLYMYHGFPDASSDDETSKVLRRHLCSNERVKVVSSSATSHLTPSTTLEQQVHRCPQPFKDINSRSNISLLLLRKNSQLARRVKFLEEENQRLKKQVEKRGRNDDWHSHETCLYKFFEAERSWADAEEKCKSRGAHLVSVSDGDESAFVRQLTGKSTFWIGLYRPDRGRWFFPSRGDWEWTDRSSFSFKRWSKAIHFKSMPSGMEFCACDSSMFDWTDHACSALLPFVCEKC